ncbi:MAG: hypothetical protein Ta2E_11790 [Mycoplasmoidaceae bacterium]|nr:MAG: hypothetical protein Ta2E_11790 [Mycoplasmoidaceae bacterium]
MEYPKAIEMVDVWDQKIETQEEEANGKLLEFSANPFKNLALLRDDINLLRSVWE